MGYKIEEIEGIGPTYASKLAEADIATTDDLLKHCCNSGGRKRVSGATGITENQLLQWTNKADLMRIPGIGSEYSDLLEAAGVDTVKELRTRNADNLANKLKEVNDAKALTRAVPSPDAVKSWIDQAAATEATITY